VLPVRYELNSYILLAVPGHALLWLIPVKWKRKKREEAHVSHMFNITMLVGIQKILWFHFLCRYRDCLVCRS
jgi:low temperature requirement protein LtrA